MNVPIFFARRYLFAKRSANAINIITAISVIGIAIGTAALLLVLSVFNGFEDLLSGLMGYFNPEIKVTPAKGKTFVPDSVALARLRTLPGILLVSETLEEIAFFEFKDAQDYGVLKGVDAQFAEVTHIDSTVRHGRYALKEGDRNFAVLGAGMSNKLSVNVERSFEPLTVYLPVEQKGGALDKPFITRYIEPVGAFAIQQEFDNQYILADLGFVREFLQVAPGTVSALEIKCAPNVNYSDLKAQIAKILGSEVAIKDRYEQNEAFFKVMKLEKFMGYAITCLMLILMAFNMVGALWMIVLDKRKDISILKSMGGSDRLVWRIFLSEGLLLTCIGLVVGMLLAIGIYALQKGVGIVQIPEGFVTESYPIAMRPLDFIPVTLTVVLIGWLASLAPAARARRVPSYLREE